jgi:hypothetical protein
MSINNDQEFLVQKIRSQYTEKQEGDLEELKELDAKVKLPANVFGYTFGAIGSIVMGSGMSLVMTDIGTYLGLRNPLFPGIIVGIVGLIMVSSCYPIYKLILNCRKKKYAAEILELSEAIMEDEQ